MILLWELTIFGFVAYTDNISLLQLICTVTPASSNSEETHNTLKFAHRAKRIEVQASQNKVSPCR
jgi:hypothetical protein